MIAEDGVLFREGLVRLFEGAGVEVVAAVGDAEALLAAVEADPPDVAIVDVRMPPGYGTEGLVVAQRLRRGFPGLGLLVLSHHVEAREAVQLIGDDARGVGYLLKDRVSNVLELVDAVERVAAGGVAIDPDVVVRLLGRQPVRGPVATLSGREREVLALMAEGHSNQAICQRLHLSSRTVESHVRRIFAGLGLPATGAEHRRVLAVLTYLRS